MHHLSFPTVPEPRRAHQPSTLERLGNWCHLFGGLLALVGFFFPAYLLEIPQSAEAPVSGWWLLWGIIAGTVFGGTLQVLPLFGIVAGILVAAVTRLGGHAYR